MLTAFLQAYVMIIAVVLVGSVIAAVAVSAHQSGMSLRRVMHGIGGLAMVLGVWFGLTHWATQTGVVMPAATLGEPPWALILMLGGALSLFALANLTGFGRAVVANMDQRWLIGLQSLRIMGWIFVALWLVGAMPWQFALPAGIGDVAVGISAWLAWRATDRGEHGAESRYWRVNIFGLVDFVAAVSTGLLTTVGFAHIWALENPNIILAYPLGLFPAFFVGVFIAIHMVSLQKLMGHKRAVKLAMSDA